MSRHRIPVVPAHYAVWYTHVAGEDAGLSAEIERLLSAGNMDEATTAQLYREFICADALAPIEAARDAVRQLTEQVSGTLIEADDDVSRYGAALSDCASRIDTGMGAEQLHAVIGDLASSTRQMHAAGAATQLRLQASRLEAEQLRAELANARREARTDALTGMGNRKALDDALAGLCEQSQAPDHCLLLADIDRFKRINDDYGHLFGDKVLKVVASTIIRAVKGADLPCRFGGEEFAVLLPDTPLDGAVTVAENIRRALERSRIVKPRTGEALGQVTISVGVTRLLAGEAPEAALARADAALYAAKQNGRNRIEVRAAPEPEPMVASV
jgi:diguanylate cyclase